MPSMNESLLHADVSRLEDLLTRQTAAVHALKTECDRLRAGHCAGTIPDTMVACGEGGNFCSETCRLRAHPFEILRQMGFEIDETGMKSMRVMERELAKLNVLYEQAKLWRADRLRAAAECKEVNDRLKSGEAVVCTTTLSYADPDEDFGRLIDAIDSAHRPAPTRLRQSGMESKHEAWVLATLNWLMGLDIPVEGKEIPERLKLVTQRLDETARSRAVAWKERDRAVEKWTMYERDYILPTFAWAKELDIDLPKLVAEGGKNCVECLVTALRNKIIALTPSSKVPDWFKALMLEAAVGDARNMIERGPLDIAAARQAATDRGLAAEDPLHAVLDELGFWRTYAEKLTALSTYKISKKDN